MLRTEIYRMLKSRSFRISLLVGCSIAIWELIVVAIPYAYGPEWAFMRSGADGAYPPSLFNSWLGGTPFSLPSLVYFFVAPLLACIPYASSLHTDCAGGFAIQLLVRSDARTYLRSKIVSSVVGAIVAVEIPLLLSLLLTATVLPALPPEATAGTFFVSPTAMLGDLFYAHTWMYLMSYFLIEICTICAIAWAGTLLGLVLPNALMTTVAPFMICMILSVALTPFNASSYTPAELLNPSPTGAANVIVALMAYGSILILCLVITCIITKHIEWLQQ
ncbi:hypothetical protein [Collinsella sp. An2]|uniref:hypothetical protein n=1 Tax=Collinsella sp. An2 TaxID=1965585 RepID=UPI000B380CD5|nr:hypothetical protein [Collinsella sp. An2]